MLLDRTHRSWAFLSAVIFAVATASYVIYAEMSPRGPTGGSLMGLLYGIVGSAFMIFAGLRAGRCCRTTAVDILRDCCRERFLRAGDAASVAATAHLASPA